ncbi:MAG: hypothetical protein ABI622_00600 [Chloroflexota bacterium]
MEVEPAVLLPSRPVACFIRYRPDSSFEAREVRAVLRAVETFQYRRSQQTGETTTTVTHTGHDEVVRAEAQLAGPMAFRAGEEVAWETGWELEHLAPPTFEGSDVLRCDWTLEISVDRALRMDERCVVPLKVAQPTALLRAGVVATGQYGLFEDAPVNIDANPAQIRLDPVPLSVAHPFSGELRLQTPEAIQVQEVRLELRVRTECTERGGLTDELLIASGRLDTPTGTFGGPFAEHPFSAPAPGVWTPSVDLRHGTARAQFHVILARAWAPDVHYVRDVALASSVDL